MGLGRLYLGRSVAHRTRPTRSGPVSRRGILVQWSLLAGLLLVAIIIAPRQRVLDRQSHDALRGYARIIDGDTLVIGTTKVRLDGIDAPETQQTCSRGGQAWRCGEAATSYLRDLIAGQQVVCDEAGEDRYGRRLAFCSAGSRELNREMVRSGMAVASGAFEAEQREARSGSSGLWSGTFETPYIWRRRHGRAAAAELPKG
jgi:endonuclease YncB( thermonuclease family)